MADSKLASPCPNSASPPPNCAICLGACTNKCFSDSCMHEFCFKCLLEWSKIKAECPLCKQAFKSIIHNIKSIDEYDEHIVENNTVEDNRYLDNASLIYLPPTPPVLHHQYHFRTTLTVDTHGEHAIQQMLLSHPLLTIGTFTPDSRYNHHRRRRGDTSATTFRRSIYSQGLWVYAPPDITGRYRDVSPSFFRNNPAARTRLVPWLNRELNALLYENTQHVMHLVDIIMDLLLIHHICSYMFRSVLTDYLGNKTDHFIHEFYNFMRSPFDMIGYDRHVIYTERRPSPIPFIDMSDYDSDVILVSDSNNNQRNGGQPAEPVIIDLDTDSDDPIIVSEERNVTTTTATITTNNTERTEVSENRKTVLPLKLRIKNRHRSKEKKRGKKRHRQVLTSSCSSSSSSSSSSTSNTSDSSSSSSSDSDCDYKRHQQKKLLKRFKENSRKKRDNDQVQVNKRALSSSSDNSSDSDKEVLANYMKRKRQNDEKKPQSSKSNHTVTSKKYFHRIKSRESSTDSIKIEDSTDNNSFVVGNSNSSKSNEVSSCLSNVENCENSYYSEHKPFVKSKIKDLRGGGEKKLAGPSSGRLRNTLRKEASTNLWYSRPCLYDSDDSDY